MPDKVSKWQQIDDTTETARQAFDLWQEGKIDLGQAFTRITACLKFLNTPEFVGSPKAELARRKITKWFDQVTVLVDQAIQEGYSPEVAQGTYLQKITSNRDYLDTIQDRVVVAMDKLRLLEIKLQNGQDLEFEEIAWLHEMRHRDIRNFDL